MVTLVWLDTLVAPMVGIAPLLIIALVALSPRLWATVSERSRVQRAPSPERPGEVPDVQPAHGGQGQEVGMFTCMICHFTTELDDVAVSGSGARCVCLRCFTRETGTARPMPAALRHAVTALLAGTPVG
jgi:hypothetical protein